MSDYARVRKARWMRRYRRHLALGTWEPTQTVPSTLAQEHIASLRSYGMSVDAIAELAGEDPGYLGSLVYPAHHLHPETITAERNARILAVRFDLSVLPETRQVSNVGTRRRIQALCRMGWSQGYIAERLGVKISAVNAYASTNRPRVSVRTARRIANLYDELSMIEGPVSKARGWAEKRGWQPPLAWDDESIDDPSAAPFAERGPGIRQAGGGVVNVDSLTDCANWGLDVAGAADRLGVDKSAIEHGIYRHAPHLHEKFTRNAIAKGLAA